MKLFFLSSQLQGFRFLDTFPWLFLFSGKVKKKFTRSDLFIISFYIFFFVFGSFIAADKLSFLKISAFLSFISLANRLCLNNYSKLNTKNFYIITLFGLIIEDLLLRFDIISPFTRDLNGAFFFFREKSYFVLILFSIISFSYKFKNIYLIFLFFIGLFTQSGLYWPFYIGLIIYLLTRKYNEYLICYFTGFGLLGSYVYLGLLGSLDNFSYLFRYIPYTDLLRPLINLTALNSNCFGTIFLQQCSEKFIVLDIKNNMSFSNWDNMTAQAPFFILYNYFGYLGIFLSFFLLILILKKIAGHRNRGFIFFNVLIQMFLQGFLLGPLFLWVLSLREEKK